MQCGAHAGCQPVFASSQKPRFGSHVIGVFEMNKKHKQGGIQSKPYTQKDALDTSLADKGTQDSQAGWSGSRICEFAKSAVFF